ncbi:alpha/beta hydrolase [Natrarchaeobaculum aegyptiacum]|uniref:Alpha/beta hydrolase n=1 Tax=Natrarchaeobaculum aegyptiacum TaxID=745377 RepID=A0A2Z2HTB4_9EURY|nr:alpha/beta hydrolase [Natrarchaeobaculum aegyptiacum]ARS90440.1 alpha/beta hydrolase [Natrarchaeobaculum aegyptiacum]
MAGNNDSDHVPRAQESGDEPTSTRRTMLKAAGVTAVAGTGLTAVSGSASAQLFGGVDVIEIDDGGLLGGWEAEDDLPVADELFVFIHGWFGDTTVSSQANDVLGAVEDGGYEPDEAVALEWPATTINFFGAESDTEYVGEVAAELIEDFYDDGGGNVRLVGHSLGGRCVLWAATKIGSSYEIETVAPLGAAADGSEVCDGPWDDATDGAVDIRNYHSENDSTVGAAYGVFSDTALGNEGAPCDPDGYTDVDVTSSVGDHFAFLGDSEVGADIAAAIEDDGDDGGGDDDDDDFGWW